MPKPPISEAGKFYFSGSDVIASRNQNGVGGYLYMDGIAGPVFVDIDPVGGWMYWNNTAAGVFRARPDGSHIQNLGVDDAAAGIVLDTHPGEDDRTSVMIVGHADKIRLQVRSIGADGKIWVSLEGDGLILRR